MATIQKWGNSLAVRIPSSVVGKLRVRAGTQVEIVANNGTIMVRPKTRPHYRLKELLKRCGRKELHGEVDLGADVGREVLGE